VSGGTALIVTDMLSRYVVAGDAVAHIHPDLAGAATRMMQVNMAAEIAPVEQLLQGAAR